jgi:hypothetical protein
LVVRLVELRLRLADAPLLRAAVERLELAPERLEPDRLALERLEPDRLALAFDVLAFDLLAFDDALGFDALGFDALDARVLPLPDAPELLRLRDVDCAMAFRSPPARGQSSRRAARRQRTEMFL